MCTVHAHGRASHPQFSWLREMLRAPSSPIIVPAKHSNAAYVKCYGHPTSPITVPASHNNGDTAKYVICPDLAHNRASQPQFSWLREILRTPSSLITVPAKHSNAAYVECYGHPTSAIIVPASHNNGGTVKYVICPDLAHNRASPQQQC